MRELKQVELMLLDQRDIGASRPDLIDSLRRLVAEVSCAQDTDGAICYGCGKTFFARWLADRARKLGFASAEVQVSKTETPLHRLETV